MKSLELLDFQGTKDSDEEEGEEEEGKRKRQGNKRDILKETKKVKEKGKIKNILKRRERRG